MSRKITIVSKPPKLEQKKRVAAYARVSSGKDAMLHSLSAQVSYYSNFSYKNPDPEKCKKIFMCVSILTFQCGYVNIILISRIIGGEIDENNSNRSCDSWRENNCCQCN